MSNTFFVSSSDISCLGLVCEKVDFTFGNDFFVFGGQHDHVFATAKLDGSRRFLVNKRNCTQTFLVTSSRVLLFACEQVVQQMSGVLWKNTQLQNFDSHRIQDVESPFVFIVRYSHKGFANLFSAVADVI